MKDYNQNLPGLEKDIINKIHRLERRGLIFEQGMYATVSFASFFGIIYSSIYVFKNVVSSGIYNYISLIFSDIEVLTYWKELSLSILESLPFLGLAIGFMVLGIFIWSLLKTAKIQVMKNLAVQI